MSLSGMSGEAFAALLVPCLPSIRRLVQSRLRAGDAAEDILQQTLLQAFKHRDQLRTPSKFKSWLYSIAVNEICMFRRSDRFHFPLEESLAMHRDESPSPLERLEQRERVSRVWTAMAMLSERDSTAIRLRDLEGLTMAETAEALRSSKPAAKSVHFRARRRLELVLRTSAAGGRRVTRQLKIPRFGYARAGSFD